jgi:signal transduction histidine kinase
VSQRSVPPGDPRLPRLRSAAPARPSPPSLDETRRALHDDVAQELFAAQASLARLVAGGSTGDADAGLADAALASVRRALRRTCDLVTGLSAADAAQDDDLGVALQRVLIDIAAPAGLGACYREAGTGAYPPSSVVPPIIAIVREALANAREHASASEVRICVRRRDDWTRISVSDNGRGLCAPQAPGDAVHTGTGLAVMQQRARALGGRVALRSRPGRGVTVTLDVPPGERPG